MNDTKIDFLSIGDILIDAFIKLQDAEVHCNIDNDKCMLSMRFGDKIPYESVEVINAVGNGPNAAVSAARLGLTSASMCHVGDDDFGTQCIQTLKENNVITDFVTTEPGQQTNYHYVLSYNVDRTILIKHAEFNYNLKKQIGDVVPRWVYFTSVAKNSKDYHKDIAQWVSENNIKMAFQPGTFQISLGHEELSDIYKATEIFFCNVAEAQKILKTDSRDIKNLMKNIHDLGPKIVCITDGPHGAYAYDSYNDEYWSHPIYPDPKPPVERTGAGDSFSSTFTVAIISGESVSEALSWGPINSMNVVQYIGAQKGLLTRDKIEEYLENKPEGYHPTQI